MLKFTLDTNCVIDIDDSREAGPCVRQLLEAAKDGTANVAMVASSASERQKDKSFLENFGMFKERLESLGFGHLEILVPILRWDVGF